MATISMDDPVAAAAVHAVRTGDVVALRALLAEDPELVRTRLRDTADDGTVCTRTLLHVVADWPGHCPHGAATVVALAEAGADVDARFEGPHRETPLHWAASCDDVAVLDALLDAGANIEARGAVIGDGTPLSDATAFAQWNAAFRLVERGAVTTLFTAAMLGLLERVAAFFPPSAAPGADEVDAAFWGACHGGRLPTARYLIERGADLNRVAPWEPLTPLDAARRTSPEADDLIRWLRALGAKPAGELAS
ncbi:hypothetical protein BLA60_04145 [Actinophytocola xinjiangensis]|uniref:Ankyrin repeat protein n=1 Tax=Actinophytocola xinjiangensis TaxID=485602 RepID=A0A7Z0WS41_9PSEU|nr:ankyrin repeat domain-containing protein [Actinophytocola xinjiangensis]OLF14328.1 hypothetical protein BLA60_04145 [Actinophytocola xinjiangensis]